MWGEDVVCHSLRVFRGHQTVAAAVGAGWPVRDRRWAMNLPNCCCCCCCCTVAKATWARHAANCSDDDAAAAANGCDVAAGN